MGHSSPAVRLGSDDVGSRVVVRHLLPDASATDVLGRLERLDEQGLAVRADVGSMEGELVVVEAPDVVAARVVPPRATRRAAGGGGGWGR